MLIALSDGLCGLIKLYTQQLELLGNVGSPELEGSRDLTVERVGGKIRNQIETENLLWEFRAKKLGFIAKLLKGGDSMLVLKKMSLKFGDRHRLHRDRSKHLGIEATHIGGTNVDLECCVLIRI